MTGVNSLRRGTGVAALLVILSITSGCAGDFGDDQKSSGTAPGEEPAIVDGDVGTDGQSSGSTPPPASVPGIPDDPSQPLNVVPSTRQLVITATIGVQVPNVGDAVSTVIDTAERHGGQVYDSDVELGDPAKAHAELVVKLPPTEAEPFIADLGGVGNVVSRTQQTDDVTDQLTDLDARILSKTASVNSVRALLDKAKDLNEIVMLEQQVTDRQTELEQLLAIRKGLADQVSLATVTVELTATPIVETATTEPVVTPAKKTGVGESFRKGWDAFVKVLVAILVFLGYTAPFLVVLLGVSIVTLMVTRRAAQPRSRSAAPPPPPAPVEGRQTSEPDDEAAARTR